MKIKSPSAILIFLAITFNNSLCQNLLKDGGFENLRDSNCLNPDQSFVRLSDWYPLNATPDLFDGACSYDESYFIFWDKDSQPFEGNNFAGIWSRWNSNGTYFSEGIATSLSEPLISGVTYFLEMAVHNRGGFQGLENSIAGCSLMPDKHIDIFLSNDSIKIDNNYSNGTSSTTASLRATLNSQDIQSTVPGEWTIVSTCFEAEGGETFLAITMPLGTFGDLPPCATTMSSSGVFRSFYYGLDAIRLTELPQSLESQMSACEDNPFEVDILELIDFPLLESASLEWNDGFTGNFRTLSEPREYNITAVLSCGSIPLTLNVSPKKCQNSILTPNIFSPNSDGQNDIFKVLIPNDINTISFQLTIYDRWGAMIFRSEDPDIGWDGSSRGQVVASGVYIWHLSFETMELNEMKKTVKTGGITVIN